MRLIALEQIGKRVQVAYRWLAEPLSAPRLLLDTPDDLVTIRRKLERDWFGMALNADEFQLVVNDHAPAALESAFPEISIVRLPGVPFDDLLYQAAPLNSTALFQIFEAQLIPFGDDPASARASLTSLVGSQVRLTGFSRRAVQFVKMLHNLTFEPQVVALSSIIDHMFGSNELWLVAIENDPGLSREEAELLQASPASALVLTDSDSFLTLVLDWHAQHSPHTALFTVNELGALHDWVTAARREQWTQWLDALPIPPKFNVLIQTSRKLVKNASFDS
jgi:hypothetical protein